jgi:hypothetical protein
MATLKDRSKPGLATERVRINAGPQQTSSSKVLPLLLAVALCSMGGLLAAWASARGERPLAVAVLVRDVKKGEVLTAGDVARAQLRSDQPVAALPWERLDELTGRQMVFDAGRGTILSRRMLTKVTQLPAGMVVVGAVLTPGALPLAGIAPGDRVMLLETPSGSDEPPRVLADEVEVWSVDAVSVASADGVSSTESTQRWLSLLVPEAKASEVATAAQANNLRLAARGARAK